MSVNAFSFPYTFSAILMSVSPGCTTYFRPAPCPEGRLWRFSTLPPETLARVPTGFVPSVDWVRGRGARHVRGLGGKRASRLPPARAAPPVHALNSRIFPEGRGAR